MAVKWQAGKLARWPDQGELKKHRSHRRAGLPGRELLCSDVQQLALGALSGRHGQDLIEDLATDVGDRRAVEDRAAIEIHVVGHVAVSLSLIHISEPTRLLSISY